VVALGLGGGDGEVEATFGNILKWCMEIELVTLRTVVQVIVLYCLQSNLAACKRFFLGGGTFVVVRSKLLYFGA
jgi:hypothetical protein